MRIHLIKSAELDIELFTKVVDILCSVPGPINFTFDKDDVVNFDDDDLNKMTYKTEDHFNKQESTSYAFITQSDRKREFPMERQVLSWRTLFFKCNDYRRLNRIDSKDFVLLLTDVANKMNWFAMLDETMPYNGFIHTGDWDHFIECPPQFPIAYEVLALFLQKHIFNDSASLMTDVHRSPIGCVSDLCMQKNEIVLKLRTADVCPTCMNKLKSQLALPLIHHALRLMESLRVKMLYAQNFRQESLPSRLFITPNHKIFLPDFGNVEIKLRPLEKALFFLFLEYPDGIYLSSLADHREELVRIYSHISSMGDMQEMRGRINDMTNALSNSASEKISRIKRCFEDSIGLELAKNYYIQGGNGEVKRIPLDRQFVDYQQ